MDKASEERVQDEFRIKKTLYLKSVYKDLQYSHRFFCFLVIEVLTIKNSCETENEIVKLECNIDDANIGDDVVLGLEEFEQVVLSWIKDIQK